jgi:hypothetical protein
VHAHPQQADAAGRVELADIVKRFGAAFSQTHRLASVQQRALRAIEACRTERLGGHLERCDACGALRYHYHSCRNRHCPKCQTLAKECWLAARRAELLPVPYFHLVFTLPHALNALAQGNARLLYALLFKSVSATLIEFGANPRWLGGEIAATLVLHTWGQTLTQHLHLHCLVAAGGLSDGGEWIRSPRGFLFPVKALSVVFRGKFLELLKHAFERTQLRFEGSTSLLSERQAQECLFSRLRENDWVVYAKRPFGGPEQVLDYLGRYTHRVAISNHRIVDVNDNQVRFRYRDYAHGNRRKTMQLEAGEFIRRFLLHVLPQGFMRIRHYGLIANRSKHIHLAQARIALGCTATVKRSEPESVEALWLRIAHRDIHRCAHCRTGRMITIAALPPAAAPNRPHPP